MRTRRPRQRGSTRNQTHRVIPTQAVTLRVASIPCPIQAHNKTRPSRSRNHRARKSPPRRHSRPAEHQRKHGHHLFFPSSSRWRRHLCSFAKANGHVDLHACVSAAQKGDLDGRNPRTLMARAANGLGNNPSTRCPHGSRIVAHSRARLQSPWSSSSNGSRRQRARAASAVANTIDASASRSNGTKRKSSIDT